MQPVRNITIVIVDDDPFTREELGRALQRDGYSITQAATSMDCLRLLHEGAAFDLLITKVSMPPPQGFALGRMAKHRNPNQKVLYISDVLDSLPENERDAANGPILAEPVHIAELLDTVRRVFASAEA